MSEEMKKGVTVKIDAALHAQVREYLETHGMTMAEFVSQALDHELHPIIEMKEGDKMANMRTLAVQIPEELFQRIKEYLQRNNMTQKQFLIGLIEDELERDLTERQVEIEPASERAELEDEYTSHDGKAAKGDFSGETGEVFEEEAVEASQASYPTPAMGMSM